MPEYRRALEPGGMFFFNVVTHNRRKLFAQALARALLRQSIHDVQAASPFEMSAVVLLPDHIHCVWRLPVGDADFSTRWARIKKGFTQRWLASGGRRGAVSPSRQRHREAGVWQRRFWEHTIRDEVDLINHVDYVHYNPVKHGLASCPHAWPHASFRRWVERGHYTPDWLCSCSGRRPRRPDFGKLDPTAIE